VWEVALASGYRFFRYENSTCRAVGWSGGQEVTSRRVPRVTDSRVDNVVYSVGSGRD
jgi:hypothetical protein